MSTFAIALIVVCAIVTAAIVTTRLEMRAEYKREKRDHESLSQFKERVYTRYI